MQRIDLQEKKCIYAKYFQTQRKLQQEKKATLSSNPVSLGHRYSTLGSEKKNSRTPATTTLHASAMTS